MRVMAAGYGNGHLAPVPELGDGGGVEVEQQQQHSQHHTRHIDRRIECTIEQNDSPRALSHELVHCALILEVHAVSLQCAMHSLYSYAYIVRSYWQHIQI